VEEEALPHPVLPLEEVLPPLPPRKRRRRRKRRFVWCFVHTVRTFLTHPF